MRRQERSGQRTKEARGGEDVIAEQKGKLKQECEESVDEGTRTQREKGALSSERRGYQELA